MQYHPIVYKRETERRRERYTLITFVVGRRRYNATAGSGVPGEVVNDTIPVPNWTWDRCTAISLQSDCGSRLGLTAKSITTNSSAVRGGIVYDLIVSSVAGDLYAPQDPMLAAYTAMEKGLYIGGFTELQRRNRAAWSEIWRGRIVAAGSDFTPDDQLMLDTAFFYLHSNVHPNAKNGVPPYGLTQSGICYMGGTRASRQTLSLCATILHEILLFHVGMHICPTAGVFWDMDSFMTRPVSLAAPSSGVALARFRTRTADSAERFAAMLGYNGVQGREALMYPWTSSMGSPLPTYSVPHRRLNISAVAGSMLPLLCDVTWRACGWLCARPCS